MNDSLDNVTLFNLEKTIHLAQSEAYSLPMLEKIASEQIQGGRKNVTALFDLGFLESNDGKASVSSKKWNKENFKSSFLSPRSKYKDDLLELFTSFEPKDGKLRFKPSLGQSIKNHTLRNLLMELDILRTENNEYVINPNETESVYRLIVSRPLSPEQLKRKMEEDSGVGLAAELFIIEREIAIEKVLPDQIHHIALNNCSAGFDIITTRENPQRTCYLEVKATNTNKSEFNISQNELEASKFLGSNYALVLVPFSNNSPSGEPEYIWDPYTNLHKGDWISSPTSWIYQR